MCLDPEQRARQEIDERLAACGWAVQDYRHAAVAAAQGVAVREVPTGAGPADYVLFVDRQAVGVIEAKKAGSTLTGVEPQTGKYRNAYPDELPAFTAEGALPFGYESTGSETRFTCGLDPIPASRRVFAFHRPETLAQWVEDQHRLGGYATLRAGLQLLPELGPDPPGLWSAQAEAIGSLERSLLENRPRALIQMATGAGKTFTAANVCYRLLCYAGARRILFLVDRANLGRQAVKEFEGFTVPDEKPIECVVFMRMVRSRNFFEQMKGRGVRVIDAASKDRVLSGEFSREAADRAREQTESFRRFIEDNKDEITALQVLYSQPYGGGLAYADIKELAGAISRPPHRWTPEALWNAYQTLDASKVRGSGHRVSTDLVSLVRHALGHTDELVAYPDLVDERFEAWLAQQQALGRRFTDAQTDYLRLIKDHIAGSLAVTPADLQNPPFSTHGGLGKARQLFGSGLDPLLEELTLALVA